jgi:hypothetical protein
VERVSFVSAFIRVYGRHSAGVTKKTKKAERLALEA